MNAASSIRFPVAFNNRERRVTISGEVYLEIASLKDKPFIVQADGTEVQVLGTSFNIKAYADEEFIETTLLNGEVKVVSSIHTIVLKPGQQALSADDKAINLVNDVDTDRVVAWKNGLFSFENADIKTLMRQLERWYGIEVRYGPELPKLNFTGKMQRNLNLSQLVRALKRMGVNCDVGNNVLNIYP